MNEVKGFEKNSKELSDDEKINNVAEIASSDLFDVATYAGCHDALSQGLDPAEHYLRYGEAAGLAPSDKFDPQEYALLNPDVAAAGVNMLLHFIRYGRMEGRAYRSALKGSTKEMERLSAKSLNELYSRQVPVVIPVFNNVTYLKNMIAQLKARRIEKIIVIDNASTYPKMQEYLNELECTLDLIRLDENYGPRNAITDPFNFSMLPDLFCLTDPDLEFNNKMPDNFIAQLAYLSNKFKYGKVGLALDISDRDDMIQDNFYIGHPLRYQKIWEHESQFWISQIDSLPDGDPVYKADIDTTFALYNKRYFSSEPMVDFFRSLRVGGKFTCKHLPWYVKNSIPLDEETYYRSRARDSTYLKTGIDSRTRYEG